MLEEELSDQEAVERLLAADRGGGGGSALLPVRYDSPPSSPRSLATAWAAQEDEGEEPPPAAAAAAAAQPGWDKVAKRMQRQERQQKVEAQLSRWAALEEQKQARLEAARQRKAEEVCRASETMPDSYSERTMRYYIIYIHTSAA
eukprot:COSAG01_NODE_2361_length_7832_cov_12.919447_8_plen_145_part_00